MNSIIDQQTQSPPQAQLTTPTLIEALVEIEEQAAYLATQHGRLHIAVLAELIEGLAQAVRQLAEENRQGWAPVLEDKR